MTLQLIREDGVVKDSVAFLSPCAGHLDPRVYQSAIAAASNASANGYQVTAVGITDRTVIHTARNILADNFVRSNCEWAFWFDSDMLMEPGTIPVMISRLKQVGGKFGTGIYVQRQGIHKPLVMVRDPKRPDGSSVMTGDLAYKDDYTMNNVIPRPGDKTPFKVSAAGFGCIITHRELFTKVSKPFFKNHWFEPDKETSEDFWFCRNALAAGYDLWCIPELKFKHMGDPVWYGIEDFKAPAETIEVLVPSAAAK